MKSFPVRLIFFCSFQSFCRSLEDKIKEIKLESSGEHPILELRREFKSQFCFQMVAGKLQSLSASNRDQRREYKSKFVDLDVEFQRMRDRMETMNQMLDDLHVSLNESTRTE